MAKSIFVNTMYRHVGLWPTHDEISPGEYVISAVTRKEHESLVVIELSFIGRVGEEKESTQIKLSKRQMDIVKYVAVGYSNSKIGDMLGLSEDTVKTHLRKVYDKTGIRNRVEVTLFLSKKGVI